VADSPGDGQPPPPGEARTPPPAGKGESNGPRPAWVLPALLFVAGLLLGGVAVAAADLGDDSEPVATSSPSPSPSPSSSPSPSPTGTGTSDVNIRVPAPCIQVAEEADAAFDEVDALAAAIRDFDARELQEFLDRFQSLRPRIEGLSQQCRERASEGLVEGNLITPTPAPTSTPS
jgi:hypothetical protein